MPTIPVYRQQTTMNAVAYRPVEIPDRISPALAKVGQGISDVGEVMGNLAIRRQKQTDALWLARTSAQSTKMVAKAFDEATSLPMTDEEKETLRRGGSVMNERLKNSLAPIRSLGDNAPSVEAQEAYSARVSEIETEMYRKGIAHDAAQKVSVWMADGEELADIYASAIDTVPLDDVDWTFVEAEKAVTMHYDNLPGDEAAKKNAKDGKMAVLREALVRRRMERDNQSFETIGRTLKEVQEGREPFLAGMTAEEFMRIEDDLAKNYRDQVKIAQDAAEDDKKAAEREFTSQVYGSILKGEIRTQAEFDRIAIGVANKFGVDEAKKLATVWSERHQDTSEEALARGRINIDAMVVAGKSREDVIKAFVGGEFPGVTTKGLVQLLDRFDTREKPVEKDAFDAGERIIDTQFRKPTGFAAWDEGPFRENHALAMSIYEGAIADARRAGTQITTELCSQAAKRAVTAVAGVPVSVPTVLGIQLDTKEACAAAVSRVNKAYENTREGVQLLQVIKDARTKIAAESPAQANQGEKK